MEDTSIPGSPRSAVSDEDVSQTNLQGKNDVILEFHVDDTTGANEEDSLMEMSFHIPSFNFSMSTSKKAVSLKSPFPFCLNYLPISKKNKSWIIRHVAVTCISLGEGLSPIDSRHLNRPAKIHYDNQQPNTQTNQNSKNPKFPNLGLRKG